jgi:hypothetical protein
MTCIETALLCLLQKYLINTFPDYSVVLYGCETWSVTLREEHRLRVFENTVLRRIFGPKRDEMTGDWRKLHNEELHNLYSSPDIIRQVNANEVGGTCGTHRRGEKSAQGFGRKARRKETTRKTKMGRWNQNRSWGDFLLGVWIGFDWLGTGTGGELL